MQTRHAAVFAALLTIVIAGTARGQDPTTPGTFDYYVFSLSWSPAYCAREGKSADPRQCGPDKNYGLIVHGLWPQYDRGGWPERCGTMRRVPARILEAMLEVMPSAGLIEHQWAKHGSCTGLSPDDYFAETRATFERVFMPDELRQPPPDFSMTAEALEKALVERNAPFGLTPKGVALVCEGDRVTEVRLCVDKELFFRDCGARVDDRCRPNARLTVR